MLAEYHQVGTQAEELLTDNTYNEIGQLSSKKVGNNIQQMDYSYNIRGWMTGINDNFLATPNLGGRLFSYKIKYNQIEGILKPIGTMFMDKNVAAKYNGNIAEVDWRAVETIGVNPILAPKRYGYAYDKLNRLQAGYYQNPLNTSDTSNTESIDYDFNGNITNLWRSSVPENGNAFATVIDQLVYTNTGNQTTKIVDTRNNYSGYPGGGNTINYDANGNITNMLDKQISGIEYNYLNLPNTITMQIETGADQTILYRADGVKLKLTSNNTTSGYQTSTSITRTIDYLDGFQYSNTETITQGGGGFDFPPAPFAQQSTKYGRQEQAFTMEDPILPPPPQFDGTVPLPDSELQFFPTTEGFYDYQNKQYIYQYKDHLGNARLSFTKNSTGVLEITDANDYYPFGMNHLKTNNAYAGAGSYKNYKYNGKELQETGMYDYGQRHYMPDIGRFNRPDRFSEKYVNLSTYSYTANNPIRFTDIQGDSIRERVKIDYSMTPNPTSKKDLGNTTDTFIGYSNLSETNINITVKIEISLSGAFKGSTSSTNIETQNPGLEREVTAHEKGHKEQIMDAAKSNVTIPVQIDGTIQSFSGPPDKVIVDANNAFNKSTNAAGMTDADKSTFSNVNIIKSTLNAMGTNINAATVKTPALENDANNRAATALGPGVQYNNGQKPVVFNGVTLP